MLGTFHLKQVKISGPLLLGKVHPVLGDSGIHVEVLLPAKLLRRLSSEIVFCKALMRWISKLWVRCFKDPQNRDRA